MPTTKNLLTDVPLLLLLKIVLPSYDIYGDCYLAWLAFTGKDADPTFGTLICVPIVFCTIMTAVACWQEETGSIWKHLALQGLVIVQLYSQYRALRVALIGLGLWKTVGKTKYESEKLKFERNVALLEPILEAASQTLVLSFSLKVSFLFKQVKETGDLGIGIDHVYIVVKIFLSVYSASMGIAAALKNGPCHVLPRNGLLGGRLTAEFGFVVNWFILGFYLPIMIMYMGHYFGTEHCFDSNQALFSLPLLSLGVLVPLWRVGRECGVSKLFQLFFRYPTILATSMFLPVSIAPNKKNPNLVSVAMESCRQTFAVMCFGRILAHFAIFFLHFKCYFKEIYISNSHQDPDLCLGLITSNTTQILSQGLSDNWFSVNRCHTVVWPADPLLGLYLSGFIFFLFDFWMSLPKRCKMCIPTRKKKCNCCCWTYCCCGFVSTGVGIVIGPCCYPLPAIIWSILRCLQGGAKLGNKIRTECDIGVLDLETMETVAEEEQDHLELCELITRENCESGEDIAQNVSHTSDEVLNSDGKANQGNLEIREPPAIQDSECGKETFTQNDNYREIEYEKTVGNSTFYIKLIEK